MWHRDRFLGSVAGIGLALRLIAAQVFFWVSYTGHVPAPLDRGGGIWFFGEDALWYLWSARTAAALGLGVVLRLFLEVAATSYQTLVTLAVCFFGDVASIGAFLSAFFWCGLAWIVIRWSVTSPHAMQAGRFAMIALAFEPSLILWSTQILKDPLVHFLLAALAGAALLWRKAWTGRLALRWIAGAAVILWISLFLISGNRWYLGLAILGALAVFAAMVALQARGRRLGAFAASLALLVSLVIAFLLPLEGAMSGFLYARLSEVVPHASRMGPVQQTPSQDRPGIGKSLRTTTEMVRSGFVRTKSGTQIEVRGAPTHLRRWFGGMLTLVVPHVLLERTGFVHVGGGRNLFWFADLDTMVFVIVVLWSIALVWRNRSRALTTDPLFWLILLSAIGLAVPLLYAVPNFGTLFRFRGMFFVLAALAPLAAATAEDFTSTSTRARRAPRTGTDGSRSG